MVVFTLFPNAKPEDYPPTYATPPIGVSTMSVCTLILCSYVAAMSLTLSSPRISGRLVLEL
jgi:hypothetical protein